MKKLCIRKKRNINSGSDDVIITSLRRFVKENCGSLSCRNYRSPLLLTERHAVGALIHGGVHFMGTHQDFVQRTEVLMATMVGTLLDSAFDAFVGMTVHRKASFKMGFGNSMGIFLKMILEKVSNVAKMVLLCYSLL